MLKTFKNQSKREVFDCLKGIVLESFFKSRITLKKEMSQESFIIDGCNYHEQTTLNSNGLLFVQMTDIKETFGGKATGV